MVTVFAENVFVKLGIAEIFARTVVRIRLVLTLKMGLFAMVEVLATVKRRVVEEFAVVIMITLVNIVNVKVMIVKQRTVGAEGMICVGGKASVNVRK